MNVYPYYTLWLAIFLLSLNRECLTFKLPLTKTTRASNTRISSFGDPDNTGNYKFKRWWQKFARNYERLIFPDETDFPGLTFATPIEWAPWMETIWFGNYYDYRSAYFQDVMYSNNVPCKEGAVLFSDATRSFQVALLYQRYRKFDESSYTVSNATFYNLFGAESLRVGRYKVAQSDDVILCVTDPLTFSELSRYLNSFNFLKWFKSKFLQQKRKRQYEMKVFGGNGKSKIQSYSDEFFSNAIHAIEYDLILNDPLIKKQYDLDNLEIPIVPCDITFDIIDKKHKSLIIPLSLANSQHFMEILWQSILELINENFGIGLNILVGGDGRVLQGYATEILARVAAANIPSISFPTESMGLSSASAFSFLKGKKDKYSAAIVMSARDLPGGIKGFFGINVIVIEILDSGEQKVRVLELNEWNKIVESMMTRNSVKCTPFRPPKEFLKLLPTCSRTNAESVTEKEKIIFFNTDISFIDIKRNFYDSLLDQFDYTLIRSFLEEYGFFVTIDCRNSANSIITKHVFEKLLDFTDGNFLNSQILPDFGGTAPSASIETATDSTELYNILPDTVNNDELPTEQDFSDCPDLGFVLDADAAGCLMLLPGKALSPENLKDLLNLHSDVKFLLELGKKTSSTSIPAEEILKKIYFESLKDLETIIDLKKSSNTTSIEKELIIQTLESEKNTSNKINETENVENDTNDADRKYMEFQEFNSTNEAVKQMNNLVDELKLPDLTPFEATNGDGVKSILNLLELFALVKKSDFLKQVKIMNEKIDIIQTRDIKILSDFLKENNINDENSIVLIRLNRFLSLLHKIKTKKELKLKQSLWVFDIL